MKTASSKERTRGSNQIRKVQRSKGEFWGYDVWLRQPDGTRTRYREFSFSSKAEAGQALAALKTSGWKARYGLKAPAVNRQTTISEAIASYVTHAMESFYVADAGNEAVFLESLRGAAQRGHEAVLARAEASGDARGMATTLTMILAIWPNLYLLHLGDSRCYRLRAGSLERLTRDQTMAQDMVDSGILPADRAQQSRFAHILSSSLGGRTSEPAVTPSDLKPGDLLMLCTDGLTKHVSDERIAARLAGLTSSEQAARQLVDDALADGGTDNVTVVVLRHVLRPNPASPATTT